MLNLDLAILVESCQLPIDSTPFDASAQQPAQQTTHLPMPSHDPVPTDPLSTNTLPTDTLPTQTVSPTHSEQTNPPNRQYKPLPLLNKLRNTQYRLRPTDTENLETIQDVIDRYSCYAKKGEDGILALMLAQETVFGINVMSQCTPLGTKTKRALPQRELCLIKRAVFDCHPECWLQPDTLEETWKTCHTAIQEGCGRQFRAKQ